jgi:hypothetical protein
MDEGTDVLSADEADEESGLYCASTFEKASFPPQISDFARNIGLDPLALPPNPRLSWSGTHHCKSKPWV